MRVRKFGKGQRQWSGRDLVEGRGQVAMELMGGREEGCSGVADRNYSGVTKIC